MAEVSDIDLYGSELLPAPASAPTPAPPRPKPTPERGEGPTADRRLKRFVADHLPGMTRPTKLNDIRVWLLLHTRANPNGLVRMSHNTIAKHLGFNEKTSDRTVKRLRKAGLLKIKEKGKFPARVVTVYRVVAGRPNR